MLRLAVNLPTSVIEVPLGRRGAGVGVGGGLVVGGGGRGIESSNISLFSHLSDSDRCEILPYITK